MIKLNNAEDLLDVLREDNAKVVESDMGNIRYKLYFEKDKTYADFIGLDDGEVTLHDELSYQSVEDIIECNNKLRGGYWNVYSRA